MSVIKDLDGYCQKLEQSVNQDCGTHFPEDVTCQARLFKSWFEEAGFYAEEVDLGPKAGHGVFATTDKDAKEYDLLLSGHLDTVFVRGTAAARPFRREGNKAFGPGVADMKDGDLAILWALTRLSAEERKRVKIAVCLNTDEEFGSLHSEAWIDSYAKRSRFALVFESATEQGLYAEKRKGISHIDVFMHGVGAHAGFCPEKGRSAITAMANCILRINALADENVTVNFGTIQGGTVANAIPEECQARIDVRFWENEQWDRFISAFKQEFEKPFGKDIRAEYDILLVKKPMIITPRTHELEQIVSDAAAELGFKARFFSSGGISDGNHISQCGTPVLDALGPRGYECHTEREWLDLTSVEESVNMINAVIRRL
ncbi:MAG: M20/M25/M40 family metallo-hydrolase [Succinivibrio sp.]|jgi:glutamate carboxypeptidase|nr:M20/M25/M40 family metallo-hydrolase [Succinivibrio sp.]